MVRKLALAAAVLVALAVPLVYAVGLGWLGAHEGPSPPTGPERSLEARTRQSAPAGAGGARQILFGDLHAHTTISFDAFSRSLPLFQGEGALPQSDACDFARHCSALDFWSINDHAESITPRAWRETIDAIRHCNAVASDPANPDTVAFLGWEWTQVGTGPENHYGHKNVVLAHTDDARIPSRPIAATGVLERTLDAVPGPLVWGALAIAGGGRLHDYARYFAERRAVPRCPDGVHVRDLPDDCQEAVETPDALFRKLDEWGHEALVIPHGTTWGMYSPPASSWDKQLTRAMHDPERQTLFEIYSGHGSSEAFRAWEDVALDPQGGATCPPPRESYLPRCWRAGQIIRERCLAEGSPTPECDARAARARRLAAEAGLQAHLTVPGYDPREWLDAGQCRDCDEPAFNYRPRGSAQYVLALADPSPAPDPGAPLRFRFGFVASSDNHFARPGTGYKEVHRLGFTESSDLLEPSHALARILEPPQREPASEPEPFDPSRFGIAQMDERERQASFYMTGGLVAVHADGRDRGAIWDALRRRETYGTSGPRILLWFDLENPPAAGPAPAPMGSIVSLREAPVFRVRALGSFEQLPGCPEVAVGNLGPERIERLCRGECYNPSDRRRRITRIEAVRVRAQRHPDEPVDGLVDDPWRVFPCDPDAAGCTARFADPEYPLLGRDTAYYVRAVEEPKPVINAGGLRCRPGDDGACAAITLCGEPGARDDCLHESEPRAWSSPIFVDWGEG